MYKKSIYNLEVVQELFDKLARDGLYHKNEIEDLEKYLKNSFYYNGNLHFSELVEFEKMIIDSSEKLFNIKKNLINAEYITTTESDNYIFNYEGKNLIIKPSEIESSFTYNIDDLLKFDLKYVKELMYSVADNKIACIKNEINKMIETVSNSNFNFKSVKVVEFGETSKQVTYNVDSNTSSIKLKFNIGLVLL